MRQYETMYVLRPELDPDAINALVTKFQHVVTQNGGGITQLQEIGKRRLAYEIEDARDGYYVLMMYQGSTGIVKELERTFKITDGVLRYLSVRLG
ncbi:30S ribosomal protein S6 [Tumebacillus avium]|uniref:Small ribosomal subunit protein bS6 n=1 Tax=Tumebacillus avium TaxID=1903704 RepID=A0A1Y0IM36_9BACL|nr:30S ribosomal protein S6 [Tumebacillus avium]ARU60876.1 30S ribosomal protein S6 [Tumebacillus avium]